MPKKKYKLKELMPKKGYQWQRGPLMSAERDSYRLRRCLLQTANVEYFTPKHAQEAIAELYSQALRLGNLLVTEDNGVGVREFWDLVKSQCWARHLTNDLVLEFTDVVAQARRRRYKLSLEIPHQGPTTKALDAWFEFLEGSSGGEFTPFYDERLEEEEMDPQDEVHNHDLDYVKNMKPSNASRGEVPPAPAAGPPPVGFTFSLPFMAPKAPQFSATEKSSGTTAPVVKKLKTEEKEHATQIAAEEEEEEDLRHKVAKMRIE